MSISEFKEKIKPHGKTLFTIAFILILGSIFFALGRLSALRSEHAPIKIQYQNSQTGSVIEGISVVGAVTQASSPVAESGEVIGSKSGKKYYYPWCGTVKRIKPENQVHFASITLARAAGFTPGGNCKGLQ